MNTKLAEVTGWYGAAAIVGAYALNSFGTIASDSAAYQLLNLTGALGIISISWIKRAMQPVALNAVWTLVALVGLIRVWS